MINPNIRYWAAVTRTKPNGILKLGIDTAERFDRRCFNFDNFTYEIWVADGARYCELFVDHLPKVNQALDNLTSVHEFEHGRIRKCTGAMSILGGLV